MSTKKWMVSMAVTAGISVISFFQINSWWADRHNFNGLFGWLGIGILFGLAACFCLYKVVKQGGTSNHQQ